MEIAQAEDKEVGWMLGTHCDPKGSCISAQQSGVIGTEPCRQTEPGVLEPLATLLDASLQGQPGRWASAVTAPSPTLLVSGHKPGGKAKQDSSLSAVFTGRCRHAHTQTRAHIPTGHTHVRTQALGAHSTPALTHSTKHLLPWTQPPSRGHPGGGSAHSAPVVVGGWTGSEQGPWAQASEH